MSDRAWIDLLRERVDDAGWHLKVVHGAGPYVEIDFGDTVTATAFGQSVDECAARLYSRFRALFASRVAV